MPEAGDLLAAARSSYARRDWPGAYRALNTARQQGELDTEDLHSLADAAWWLGLIKETLTISETCYRQFLEEGRPRRAAMNALEVGFSWIPAGSWRSDRDGSAEPASCWLTSRPAPSRCS